MKSQTLLTTIDRIVREVRSFGIGFPLWRIRPRGTNGYVPFTCHGRTFYMRKKESDHEVLFYNLIKEEYKIRSEYHWRKILDLYDQAIVRGTTPLIIDAGANIGLSSAWFAMKFPLAQIVSVEPDSENAQLARLNLADFPNSSVLNVAIGGESGFVKLIASDAAWGISTERSTEGIPLTTIPEIVGSYPNVDLLIVKIDIEGFEKDLFARESSWTSDAGCIIIEPHDWKFPGEGTSQTSQAALFGKGRDILISGENIVLI